MTNPEQQTTPATDAGTGREPAIGAHGQEAAETVRTCVVIYGVMSAVIVGTLAVAASASGSVSTYMWVRASILLGMTVVFHRLAVRAGRNDREAVQRLRTLTTTLPIAIVAVDLIPGVCPTWYAAMQAASAVPLVAIAVLARRRGPLAG